VTDREPTYTVVFLPHDGRQPWRRDNLTLERAAYFCGRDAVEALLVVRNQEPTDGREWPWWPLLRRLGLIPLAIHPRIVGHVSLRGVVVIGYIPPLLAPTSWEHLLGESQL